MSDLIPIRNPYIRCLYLAIIILLSVFLIYMINAIVYPTALFRDPWGYSDIFVSRWLLENRYVLPDRNAHPYLYITFGKIVNILEENPLDASFLAGFSALLHTDALTLHGFFPLGQLYMILSGYLVGKTLFKEEERLHQLAVLATVVPMGPVIFRVGLSNVWTGILILFYALIFYVSCKSLELRDGRVMIFILPLLLFLRYFYVISALFGFAIAGVGLVYLIASSRRFLNESYFWRAGLLLLVSGIALFASNLSFPSVAMWTSRVSEILSVPELAILSDTIFSRVSNLLFFLPFGILFASAGWCVLFRNKEIANLHIAEKKSLVWLFPGAFMLSMFLPALTKFNLVTRPFLYGQVIAMAAWLALAHQRITVSRRSKDMIMRTIVICLTIASLFSAYFAGGLVTAHTTSGFRDPVLVEGLQSVVARVPRDAVILSDLRVAGALLILGHEDSVILQTTNPADIEAIFYSGNMSLSHYVLKHNSADYLLLTTEMITYGVNMGDYPLQPIPATLFPDYTSSDMLFTLEFTNGVVYLWKVL